MSNSGVYILDLPHEILCAICNQLCMVDVFYSLVGVSLRLDRIALDPPYIDHVDVTIHRAVTHFEQLGALHFNGGTIYSREGYPLAKSLLKQKAQVSELLRNTPKFCEPDRSHIDWNEYIQLTISLPIDKTLLSDK